jgi:hypothetical protein
MHWLIRLQGGVVEGAPFDPRRAARDQDVARLEVGQRATLLDAGGRERRRRPVQDAVRCASASRRR